MSPFFNRRLYMCTMFLVSLTSTAAGLSLEDLSLEIRKLRQSNEELTLKVGKLERNDVAKDVQLQELRLKVQHLETKLTEEQKIRQTSYDIQSAWQGSVNTFGKQVHPRNAIFRTCRELHKADPSLASGMYWIDPDGQGIGDDPIYVECDMSIGKTSVLHDSEDPTDVGHCADPGCYSRSITYSASTRQLDALAELSTECHQSIRYDCNYAPFETIGTTVAWWNDRNGDAQYFWSGGDNSSHTCQCGIDHNCVEVQNFCNCDSLVPVPLNDSGVITDKSYLPITRLNFGRTQLETSSGVHTLGRFECTGQISVDGMPTSCSDLWKIGHTLSGIYSVMGSDFVETVYCNFSMLPHEQGYQTMIGFSDVKSSPVYFYVQKNVSQSVLGIVPFEVARLNIGGAMNLSTGIFTAPRSGIYSFAFTGAGFFPLSSSESSVRIALMLNNVLVGHGLSAMVNAGDNSYHTISLNSVLELNANDQVWISVDFIRGATLHDNTLYFTHFTGHLLQENVASSFL